MLKWSDKGIIINIQKKGEKGNLVNIFTKKHGRHLGWLNIYNKKKINPQPGDLVVISWSSRISSQLGSFKVELIESIVGKVINDEIKLNIISSFCSLVSIILPERQICINFFEKSLLFLKKITNELPRAEILKLYILWEIEVLREMGQPLNFSKCIVSGKTNDLKFVSPKSGNAVAFQSAGKYENQLLKLPFFLGGYKKINNNDKEEIFAGFDLTFHFIKKNLYSLDFKNLSTAFIARNRLYNNFKMR